MWLTDLLLSIQFIREVDNTLQVYNGGKCLSMTYQQAAFIAYVKTKQKNLNLITYKKKTFDSNFVDPF